MQPELQLSFRRGTDELTIELCHDVATAEFLIVTRHTAGTSKPDRTDRFVDLEQATAYMQFIEGRLTGEHWQRTQVRRWTKETVIESDSTPAADGRQTAQLYRMNVAAAPAQPERPTGETAPSDDEAIRGAYALEEPLVCPHCREWIRSIKVVRLSRTQVPFTSTLPRSGRALACSACEGILSLELAGFI
jgi:hypothetical protein